MRSVSLCVLRMIETRVNFYFYDIAFHMKSVLVASIVMLEPDFWIRVDEIYPGMVRKDPLYRLAKMKNDCSKSLGLLHQDLSAFTTDIRSRTLDCVCHMALRNSCGEGILFSLFLIQVMA